MPEEGGKEQRGTVLVLGGLAERPEAIRLPDVVALRAGAGRCLAERLGPVGCLARPVRDAPGGTDQAAIARR